MTVRRRIAVLSTMEGAPWGGSEELWAAAADEALEAGHTVGLFLRRWPETPASVRALVERGASLHARRRSLQAPLERALSRVARTSVEFPSMPRVSTARRLKAFAPDVVIASEGTLCSLAAMRDVSVWLEQSATPYVSVCQHVSDDGLAVPELRARAARVYRDAACAMFVARANLTSAERLLAVRLPHARVIGNPVNMRDEGALPAPRNGRAHLAVVGRLDARTKGQDALFAALANSGWAAKDWGLRLYGTGADAEYLSALGAELGIARRIEFVGHVADVRAIWAENDLLVLPSRSEGTPLALVEAMLCGRPAVVTDVGGNAEWVEDGSTGWVAPAPTPRAIDAALSRAWDARASWPTVGARARARAMILRDPRPGRTLLDAALTAAARC